ncbi:MAG: Gfo/Idh/MocA family oxidoreductase [Bacteroidota bacterium]
MQAIRIALIGGGIWGSKILRDLRGLGATVAVFDPDPARELELLAGGAQRVSTGLPTDATAWDGFIVASPSTTHRAVLEAILPLGVPVFVEKPLTTNYADALALQAIVHERVFLMHVWRYHAGVLALAEIARSGELGEVLGLRTTRANWTSPRRDTDSLWNLAPHDLTIALAILGHLPKPRAAVLEEHEGTVRGGVLLLGQSPYAVFEVSNRYERKEREVRLHCQEGVAVLRNERVDYVSIYRGDAHQPAAVLTEERRPFSGPSPLQAELAEFLEYLAGGPPPRCDFAEGLAVVRALHEMEQLGRAATKPSANG